MNALTLPRSDFRAQFAADVRAGLCRVGQKQLPSKYLYDALGSVLFDAITLLPEYGLTRADERLLQRHRDEIALHVPRGAIVAELGSGSGRKTRAILDALRRHGPLHYYPIEISRSALDSCEAQLHDIESVSIVGVESEYLLGLAEVARRRAAGVPLCVLFLGSTIGNFDAGADVRFLRDVRRSLRGGDVLLLGTDLLKDARVLRVAYDDALGVTAAFNRNLLGRINRELDGEFDLHAFAHEARFNARTRSIEMHLRACGAQSVRIGALGTRVAFADGETIWTETSHKYDLDDVAALAHSGGFAIDAQWTDTQWPFANSLLRVP